MRNTKSGTNLGLLITIVMLILKLTDTVAMPWFSMNLFQPSVFWAVSFSIWGFVIIGIVFFIAMLAKVMSDLHN